MSIEAPGDPIEEMPAAAAEPIAPSSRLLIYLGGGSLLLAMATDFLAVLGRHLGRPLLGSIEIIQAAILISSSVALVMATLARRHAVVHLVVDRLGPRMRDVLVRLGRLAAALFCLALAAGSALVVREMWGGHEESELLRIPYAPLRLISLVSTVGLAALFAVQAIRQVRR